MSVDIRQVIVGLGQVDMEAYDGADAARIELREGIHQEDKHRRELVQHARDDRLHVLRVPVEPRHSRIIGMWRSVISVVMPNSSLS